MLRPHAPMLCVGNSISEALQTISSQRLHCQFAFCFAIGTPALLMQGEIRVSGEDPAYPFSGTGLPNFRENWPLTDRSTSRTRNSGQAMPAITMPVPTAMAICHGR